jgi:succinoglycan biosynthesis transport protein ExoP
LPNPPIATEAVNDAAEGPGVLAAMVEHWKVAVVIIGATLAAVLVLTMLQPRVYRASTRVSFVDPQTVPFPRSNARLQDDLNRYLAVIADTAESRTVLDAAASQLGVSADDLDGQLAVEVAESASALDIKTSAASRDAAAARTTAVVSALQSEMAAQNAELADTTIASIDTELAEVDAAIASARADLDANPGSVASQQILNSNLSLRSSLVEKRNELATNASAIGDGIARIEQVTVRSARSGPGLMLSMLLGLALGVLAAAVVCWVLATRRPRARHSADPARIVGAPLLARVPDLRRTEPGALRAPPTPPAEAFAVLGAALGPWHSNIVVVTGSKPGDGATTTCLNLAVSLALAGRRVVLVDADLRHAELTQRLGFTGQPGLMGTNPGGGMFSRSDEGDSLTTYECRVRSGSPSFQFVPSGTEGADSAGGLLWSPSLVRRIADLSSTFDAVVVDTPSLNEHPDAVAMGDYATSLVLVVKKGALLADLSSAADVLVAAAAPVAGYVFNQAGSGESVNIRPWTGSDELARVDVADPPSTMLDELAESDRAVRRGRV